MEIIGGGLKPPQPPPPASGCWLRAVKMVLKPFEKIKHDNMKSP